MARPWAAKTRLSFSTPSPGESRYEIGGLARRRLRPSALTASYFPFCLLAIRRPILGGNEFCAVTPNLLLRGLRVSLKAFMLTRCREAHLLKPALTRLAVSLDCRAMKVIIAADPFALSLKNAVVEYLKEKGHEVVDLGSTDAQAIPYYEGAVVASRALQAGQAQRAILLCGTGMGMAVIANRFAGVVAAAVESVFAARMCRAINDANALCLGAMIWGEWMAKEAVEAFLTTNLADGLPQFADFLKDATKKVEAIRPTGS
jgi:ribose 5-phosphate isomerase B